MEFEFGLLTWHVWSTYFCISTARLRDFQVVKLENISIGWLETKVLVKHDENEECWRGGMEVSSIRRKLRPRR